MLLRQGVLHECDGRTLRNGACYSSQQVHFLDEVYFFPHFFALLL